MRGAPNELARRLTGGLPRAVLLFGEEPLLIEESVRTVRQAARDQGFTDRIPLSAETGFDWGRLTGTSQTLSLFAERRLIELRLPTGRPGDAGTQAFADYLQTANDDVCLLVITGRLDARAKQAKWVKTLDEGGLVVEHRALKAGEFQNWFRRRLKERNLVLEGDTVEKMCHFLEGNLLAAAQEIDRVALFAQDGGRVDSDAVSRGLIDHARFNVYAVTEASLKGDVRKALRILKVLRNEGTEPVLVTWALAKELRTLVRVSQGLRNGERKERLFKTNGIWSARQPQINAALNRLGEGELRGINRRVARCDRVLKGRASGDIWHELDVLVLAICGVRYATEIPVESHATG